MNQSWPSKPMPMWSYSHNIFKPTVPPSPKILRLQECLGYCVWYHAAGEGAFVGSIRTWTGLLSHRQHCTLILVTHQPRADMDHQSGHVYIIAWSAAVISTAASRQVLSHGDRLLRCVFDFCNSWYENCRLYFEVGPPSSVIAIAVCVREIRRGPIQSRGSFVFPLGFIFWTVTRHGSASRPDAWTWLMNLYEAPQLLSFLKPADSFDEHYSIENILGYCCLYVCKQRDPVIRLSFGAFFNTVIEGGHTFPWVGPLNWPCSRVMSLEISMQTEMSISTGAQMVRIYKSR